MTGRYSLDRKSQPVPSSTGVVVTVFGRTDVGLTREHNEDAFLVADLTADNATLQPEVRTHAAGSKGSLFMVADGMGGAAAGEIASAMATDVVLQELRATWLPNHDGRADAFARAIKDATRVANRRIHEYALSHPEYRGMGTTATIAGLLGDTLYIAQIGDSRAYLIRNGEAKQITKDQSLMQKLIEAGELTEEEAEQSERRNIILQALGPETTIKIDLTHQKLRRGDTLVLCSDGLSGQVGRDEIARVVAAETDLTAACKRLIDLANEAGGPDNITVVIARFEGEGLAGPAEEDEVGHRVFPLSTAPGDTPPAGVDRASDPSMMDTGPVPVVQVPSRSRPTVPVPAILDETMDSEVEAADSTVPARDGSTAMVYAVVGLLALAAGLLIFTRC